MPKLPLDLSDYLKNLRQSYTIKVLDDGRACRYTCKACTWNITLVPETILLMERPELVAERLNGHACLGRPAPVQWVGVRVQDLWWDQITTLPTALEELFPV